MSEIVRCGKGYFPDPPTSLNGDNKRKKSKIKIKQEGQDGPVSLHWQIFGNLFKTLDPEEGLKLVAMSSNKKISKYFTR